MDRENLVLQRDEERGPQVIRVDGIWHAPCGPINFEPGWEVREHRFELFVGLEERLICLRRRHLGDDVFAFERARHTRSDVDVLDEPRRVCELVTRSAGDASSRKITVDRANNVSEGSTGEDKIGYELTHRLHSKATVFRFGASPTASSL